MHASDLVIYALALVLTVLAYLHDPGAPVVGLKAGARLFLDILPRSWRRW